MNTNNLCSSSDIDIISEITNKKNKNVQICIGGTRNLTHRDI